MTANFLNWVSEQYGGAIVTRLNAAAREGKDDEGFWKKHTGHSAPELGQEWKESREKELAIEDATPC